MVPLFLSSSRCSGFATLLGVGLLAFCSVLPVQAQSSWDRAEQFLREHHVPLNRSSQGLNTARPSPLSSPQPVQVLPPDPMVRVGQAERLPSSEAHAQAFARQAANLFIVMYDGDAMSSAAMRQFLQDIGVREDVRFFSSFAGFSVVLTEIQVEALITRPEVTSVTLDTPVGIDLPSGR